MVKIQLIKSYPVSALFCQSIDIIKWSADNQIALLHRKGGIVIDLAADPCQNGFELPLTKSILPVPQPAQNLSSVYLNEKLMNGEDKHKVYDLFRDRIITPRGFVGVDFHNFYSKVDWSPHPLNAGPSNKARCLLAALSSTFRMVIFSYVDRTKLSNEAHNEAWPILLDISKLYNGVRYQKWMLAGEKYSDLQFEEYKSRLYELTTVDFAWVTPIVVEEGSQRQLNEAFLITGQANGDIVIWWITVSPDSGQLTAEPILTRSVVPNEVISVMNFCRISGNAGVLSIGTNSGVVKVFRLEVLITNETREGADFVPSEPQFIMNDGFEIWEKDMLKIEFIECVQCKNKNILKAPTVDLLIVKHPNYLLSTLMTISVKDIDFKPVEHYENPNGLIVGISTYSNDYQFMLSHEIGVLSLICIENGSICFIDDSATSINDDSSSNISDNYLFNGLAISPNKIMACVGKNLNCAYDHLKIREPASIAFFSLLQSENAFVVVTALYAESRFSLLRISDALIAFRYIIQVTDNIYLHSYLLELTLGDMSAEELRFHLWVMKAAVLPTGDEGMFGPGELQSFQTRRLALLRRQLEIEDLIMRKRFVSLLKLVGKNQSLPEYTLSDKNSESLRAIRTYLGSKPDKIPSSPRLQGQTPSLCPVCNTEVSYERSDSVSTGLHGMPWDSQTCKNKHRFPVCVLSLVPCNFPYRACANCRITALVNPAFGQDPVCPFCTAFMLTSGSSEEIEESDPEPEDLEPPADKA